MKTCYKVVSAQDGDFYSINYESLGFATTHYPVREWAESEYGPLLCFENFASAFRFSVSNTEPGVLGLMQRLNIERHRTDYTRKWQIWLAEGDNQRDLPRYRLRLGVLPYRNFARAESLIAYYWNEPGVIVNLPRSVRTEIAVLWPWGTVAFQQIRLLERII